jgi:hypothetical protein
MDSWVLSLIAVVISLTSAAFVIIDKFKVWGSTGIIKKLKRDRQLQSLKNSHLAEHQLIESPNLPEKEISGSNPQ